jgi:hypothetical protein
MMNLKETGEQVDVVVEVVGQPRLQLCPAPGASGIEERVEIPTEMVGERFVAVLSNLTSTGAAIESPTMLPLLSRIALTFEMNGVRIEALGIVMWRRATESQPGLKRGFGVLFEAVLKDGREALEALDGDRGASRRRGIRNSEIQALAPRPGSRSA